MVEVECSKCGMTFEGETEEEAKEELKKHAREHHS